VGINRNRGDACGTAATVPGIQGEKVKRQPIERDSRAVLKLIELINANPGLTMRQLMARACYSISHTKNALSRISAFGDAAPVYIDGGIVGWFPMELARVKQAEWANSHERRAQQARENRKKRDAVMTAAKAEKLRLRDEKRAAAQPTLRERMCLLCKAPEGASAAQMLDSLRSINLSSLGKHTRELERQKRIFRADRNGARLRYFDTPERAKEWEALPPMEPSEWQTAGIKAWENNPHRPRSQKEAIREAARQAREERRLARLVAIGERLKSKAQQPRKAPPKTSPKVEAIKLKPAEPAPVTLHSKPSDIRGAVDYSKAKITICPAPKFNYRHEYAPGSEAWTGFAKEWKQLRGAA
jgi:hypothetical protein